MTLVVVTQSIISWRISTVPRHLDTLEDVGREDGLAGVPVDGVRGEQREVALLLERAQGVEAVVVLVVAERAAS